jgi:hypothetical protein
LGSTSVRDDVLDILREALPEGLTDSELQARVNGRRAEHDQGRALGDSSVRTRRHELVRAGLLEPVIDADGRPVTRPTASGCPSRVWRATAPQPAKPLTLAEAAGEGDRL